MSVRSNEGVFGTIYDHVFTVSFHDFKTCNICKYINFLNVNLLKSKSIHFFMNIFRGQEVIFMASSLSAYKIIGCLMLYHVHVYCRLLFIYSSIVINRFMAIMLSLLIHAQSCKLYTYRTSPHSFDLCHVFQFLLKLGLLKFKMKICDKR